MDDAMEEDDDRKEESREDLESGARQQLQLRYGVECAHPLSQVQLSCPCPCPPTIQAGVEVFRWRGGRRCQVRRDKAQQSRAGVQVTGVCPVVAVFRFQHQLAALWHTLQVFSAVIYRDDSSVK